MGGEGGGVNGGKRRAEEKKGEADWCQSDFTRSMAVCNDHSFFSPSHDLVIPHPSWPFPLPPCRELPSPISPSLPPLSPPLPVWAGPCQGLCLSPSFDMPLIMVRWGNTTPCLSLSIFSSLHCAAHPLPCQAAMLLQNGENQFNASSATAV